MTDKTVEYVHGHPESVLRSHRWRTAANSAGYLLSDLRPGLDLLDVGCGPGTITVELAELVAPGRVVAVDAEAEVLAAAREHAARRGLTGVEFTSARVESLPFPDDSFDVVHAHQVLQHVGDPVRALREMRRVCRPGGLVAVRDADYAAMAWYPELPELDDWLGLYRRVARAAGGEPDAGRRLLAWARAAGYDNGGELLPSASVWCFSGEDDRAWWGGLWADRTVEPDYATRVTDGGHGTSAELSGIADAWRRWRRHPDAWFSVLHGEVRHRLPRTGTGTGLSGRPE
ncbi:methyltransferase domain-containing protein [Streptomyces sp. OF3]|uniref:Methyltransferase domain-containing protein n=1 Tax=Streptomyces alkaliterrae TaxID=2213162 RepID=A0A7W3WGE4_9ACTN|nr:methyltransferase domain-containing protein [Streptomyces alkaliterrae]MBB1251897.1 methyltransferase domain-containing protein [Streptomyces alkaliterrae]